MAPTTTTSLSTKLVLLVLAALPAAFATGFSSYELFRQDLLLLTSGLTLAIWGVELVRQRSLRAFSLSALAPLGLLALWAALSSLWSPVPLAGLLDSSLLLSLLALAVPLALPTGAPLSWRHLFGAASVGTLLAGTFGLLDQADVSLFTPVFNPPGPTGAFDAAEFGMAYYVIALPLSAALLASDSHKGLRALGGLALLAGSAHMALLGTSWMGLVALAAGMVIPAAVLLIHQDKLAKKLSPLALGAAVLVLVAAGLGPAQFGPSDEPYNPATSLPIVDNQQLLTTTDFSRVKLSRDARFALTRIESSRDPLAHDYLHDITLSAAKDRPFLGLGAGGWWLSQSRFVAPAHAFLKQRFDIYPAFRSTHNGYAKLFIEYGVLGLLCFVAMLFAAVSAFSSVVKPVENAEVSAENGPAPLDAHAFWGLGAALLAGAIFMATSAMIELAAPMALLAACLITLTTLGQLTHPVASHRQPLTAQRNVLFVTVLGVLVAAGLLVLGAKDVTSSYYRGKADQLMLVGKIEQAREAYLTSHELLPARGETIYNYALGGWRIGETEDMGDTIEQAHALRPDDARILHMIGRYHLGRQEFAQAIEAEKSALAHFPNYLDAYKNISVAYDRSLDFENATKTMEDALSLDPPKGIASELHYSAGMLYAGPAAKPAKALEHFKAAFGKLENRSLNEQIKVRISELEKQIERERLMREGKPVPKHLLPVKEHNEAGEMLGIPGAHEGHDH